MDKDVLINRYEQLRSQALGKLFASNQGLGLALFMRKGMVSWAKAWTECTPKVKAPSTHNPDIDTLFSENINSQITMVLTNMIMDLNQKEIEYGFPGNSESDERAPAAQDLSPGTQIRVLPLPGISEGNPERGILSNRGRRFIAGERFEPTTTLY